MRLVTSVLYLQIVQSFRLKSLKNLPAVTVLLGLSWAIAITPSQGQQEGGDTEFHALSLIGEPKYGPDFEHLDYVNPNAPKGGQARISAFGGFDSLNPFISAGDPAGVVRFNVYEPLMTSPLDDITAEYGLIAESVKVPADSSWVEFSLRPEARWHDGKPITADDVIYSFELLTKEGQPLYQYYYRNVVKAKKIDERRVRFEFDEKGNRELPQIMGQVWVLPKHHWEGRKFDEPTLEPPLGSGPYKVGEVKPGRSVTLDRAENYWAADLPINRGQNNFDHITVEYFRDESVEMEAFKAGQYDFRDENSAKRWATEYEFTALQRGDLIKAEVPHKRPTGMQAFVFNTRRPVFQDRRVRQALSYAWDFEWTRKTLFYGQYERTESFFSNSEMASEGLPSEEELALLEPLRAHIPAEVFTIPFEVPRSDGSGNNRDNLRTAVQILREAGWGIKDGMMTHARAGQKLEFEILLVQPTFERVVLPFIDNLKRLGVRATIRIVDPAQYQRRMIEFDFDLVISGFGQSNSPGNEQRDFWGSEGADTQGSRNIIGIKNPAVDALIEKIVYAETREKLVTATRALDRVLLHSHFVIPQYHVRTTRIAYWNRFGRPAKAPDYAVGFLQTWWLDVDKNAALGDPR